MINPYSVNQDFLSKKPKKKLLVVTYVTFFGKFSL